MGEYNQQFESFQSWVNKGRSWLGRRDPYEKAICIDAKGRVCRNGGDMMRARDEDAFPVRWLWPDDVAALVAGSSPLSPDGQSTSREGERS